VPEVLENKDLLSRKCNIRGRKVDLRFRPRPPPWKDTIGKLFQMESEQRKKKLALCQKLRQVRLVKEGRPIRGEPKKKL